jgi:hypothetical protein
MQGYGGLYDGYGEGTFAGNGLYYGMGGAKCPTGYRKKCVKKLPKKIKLLKKPKVLKKPIQYETARQPNQWNEFTKEWRLSGNDFDKEMIRHYDDWLAARGLTRRTPGKSGSGMYYGY